MKYYKKFQNKIVKMCERGKVGMLTKQQVEREILELNSEYNQRKEKLNHKLFELMQL